MGGGKEEIGLRFGFLKGFFEDEGVGRGTGREGVEGVERSLMKASIPLRAC